MERAPKLVQFRYNDTHLVQAPGGKRVLAKLPKREAGERREIKRILSSHHCKRCSKCCRGAFSIGETDPNFGSIMEAVRKRKEEFRVEAMGMGRSGTKYYDIGVPRKRNACGFLNWERGQIDHRTLVYSDGKKDGYGDFSCEIYDARASVCMAYPFNITWMSLELEDGTRDDEGTIILDVGCQAIMELLENGIGHLTESEILSLAAESGVDGESLLFSVPRSLQEVKDRVAEYNKENRILVNEEGERIYPMNVWELFMENMYLAH